METQSENNMKWKCNDQQKKNVFSTVLCIEFDTRAINKYRQSANRCTLFIEMEYFSKLSLRKRKQNTA